MPHPRGFEQHVLPREPYTQSAPTQKPVPPLINVRLVWRDAFDIRIASIGRVLLGGSKYMYLRLLSRDVLSILARNGAERRRSGAWKDGTATAELNATTTTWRPPRKRRYTATTTSIAFFKILGQREGMEKLLLLMVVVVGRTRVFFISAII